MAPHTNQPHKSFILVGDKLSHPAGLVYIYTKYHQNIVRGVQVTDQTRTQVQTQEDKERSPRKKK